MSSTDYELVIESVRGEMRRDGADNKIDIQKFEFETHVAREGASGVSRMRRQYTDVTFTKLLDRASPTLQSMLATNSVIKTATLKVYKAAGDQRLLYYKLILSDGYISSYKIVGEHLHDEYGAIPRDEFSINFRKIEVDYTKQAQEGGGSGSVSFTDTLDSNR